MNGQKTIEESLESGTKINLLVGFSGSVATIKDAEILRSLKKTNIFNLKVIYTKSACHFMTLKEHKDLEDVEVYFDEDEWKWNKRGDPVLHIELRKWADMLLVAPLSANTLAKFAQGLCDNLLVKNMTIRHAFSEPGISL